MCGHGTGWLETPTRALMLPQPHSVQDLAVAMPDAAAFSLSRIVVILTLFFILNTAYNTTEHFYRSRKIYYVQGRVTWLQCTYSRHWGDFRWKWLPRDSPSAPQDGEGLSCFLQHRGYSQSSCSVLINPHPSAGQIAFFQLRAISFFHHAF